MSRTVLVTGGGTGIGRAVAAAFAAGGDHVVITGRRAEVLHHTAKEIGPLVTALPCDATDPDQLQDLRGRLPDTVHVLVNNAGGNRDLGAAPTADLRLLAERWRANLDANLLAAVLTTAAVDQLLTDGGAVVNVGSFAADRGAGSYGASKAAMNTWNIALARQFGPRGVTCNVVAPGYVEDTEFFGDRRSEQFRRDRVAETLVGRAGRTEDVAEVVRFLASPAARHITGQVLRVDGGVIPTR
ncbi:SDR family oxidoreductase [Streptomyces sp. N2-109]|uniref:SDR family oxidoreductase n=1 Tax=Streptomyces gossypii TaxID=2883101 RepID=A0ABT2JSY0_9ACTN|nr:SDR family oxidoreductase [Streptomyces gossypii]MCT2590998.1 SDR family oxidoreductase [Streptomyces gossypii]